MKLVNAKFYEEQIKRKMWEIWYDEKYQYYFNSICRRDFSLQDNTSDVQHAFAALNNDDELIGYISYLVDVEMRVAYWYSAINFSDDVISFGLALRQVIKNCFLKFGMEVVEWRVFCGNPIEESYDRMCERIGGHIQGVMHRRTKNLAGDICDEKVYEVLREDFLKATQKPDKKTNK